MPVGCVCRFPKHVRLGVREVGKEGVLRCYTKDATAESVGLVPVSVSHRLYGTTFDSGVPHRTLQ